MHLKQRVYCYSVGVFTVGLGIAVATLADTGVALALLGGAIIAVTAVSGRQPAAQRRSDARGGLSAGPALVAEKVLPR